MATKSTKKDDSTFFSNLGNHLVVLLLKAFSHLPFICVYALSDFLYFLNKTILKYRYAVVTENLQAAFPEKTEAEITEIRNKFYQHFFDFSLEAVKMNGMTHKQMSERNTFKGVPQSEKIMEERVGGIVLAFHYNNWEWGPFVNTQFKFPTLMVYNPPRDNKPMEDFLTKLRGKWGGKVIRTSWAARYTFAYKQKGEPAALWLAADQRALASSPLWINFLNREAPFFAGPELLAKKTNHPIFFYHIRKIARGKYEHEFSLLVDEPAKLEPNEILRRYVQKMEEVIKSEPEYYLWSHKRWKHTRPAHIPLID